MDPDTPYNTKKASQLVVLCRLASNTQGKSYKYDKTTSNKGKKRTSNRLVKILLAVVRTGNVKGREWNIPPMPVIKCHQACPSSTTAHGSWI